MADLTYSKTYKQNTMDRMECDGYRGNYVAVEALTNSGYTVSGNTNISSSFCDVVITTPEVTVTWMNKSGGASYKFYVVLETDNASYTSAVITQSWNYGETKTLVFKIPNVLGAWKSYQIWGKNWTFSEKDHDKEHPWVYWCNNDDGTFTVEYTRSSGMATSAFVRVGNDWKQAVPYRWQSLPIEYSYPEDSMNGNESRGCIAKSSSDYDDTGTYEAYKAFDLNESTRWQSSKNSSGPWVQLQMPRALYNISVKIVNRSDATPRGPISGCIYGTTDGNESTLDEIGSYSGQAGATAGHTFTVTCTNTDVAYNTVRVKILEWNGSSSESKHANIAEVYISGTDVPMNGGWIQATPAVWNGGWKQ